jgi:hypothetical protein
MNKFEVLSKDDEKSIKYARIIKPYLKRMYEIVEERKKLSKEFKDLTERIQGLNSYLLKNDD